VYGLFRLSPNTRNVRDLDIEIDVDFAVRMILFAIFKNIFVSPIVCRLKHFLTSSEHVIVIR
jgi:hypothetical protein